MTAGRKAEDVLEPREQREDEQGQEEPDEKEVPVEVGEVQEEEQVHPEEPEDAVQGNGSKTLTYFGLLFLFKAMLYHPCRPEARKCNINIS